MSESPAVARAKAAQIDHAAWVAREGIKVTSQGVVPDLLAEIARLQTEVERLQAIEHAADRVWRAWDGGIGLGPSLEHLQQVLGPEVPPHLESPE